MESSRKRELPAASCGGVPTPPRGLGILMVLGPGLVWCGEYIGSGEVILSTRTGALFGMLLLWGPTLAIFSKYWIGMAGARYTVCTGEGMIDMMSRTPGPRNWVVWPVFIGQLCSGAISTGAIASTAGVFAAQLIPLPPHILGWGIMLSVFALVWTGKFEPIKKVMSVLVAMIILGVFDVALTTWPGGRDILTGLFGFNIPDLPDWYTAGKPVSSMWWELLPLLGWAAGGFASQVWYSYWVMGAGYGMAYGREYGSPLDAERLRNMTRDEALRVKGWCRIVYCDASMACMIGVLVTGAFMVAGAGVLGPAHIAPDGEKVAFQLSSIFSEQWGRIGAHLFILAGLAAMISTLVGQFAGWPRLLADCARVLIPGVARFSWRTQFRSVLTLFAVSNIVIVFQLGLQPVLLVKTGAVLDGLLLTPLQALAVGLTLYIVMPKFFSREVRQILKPSPIFAAGLLLAFVVFSYFCVTQLPGIIAK